MRPHAALRMVQDAHLGGDLNRRNTQQMATGKAKRAKCEDCFFHKNMLCALKLDEPCTTFRPAERNLAPESQLAFTFRTDRTRVAYAFQQPN